MATSEIDPNLEPDPMEVQRDYWMDRALDAEQDGYQKDQKIRSQALDIISYLGQLGEQEEAIAQREVLLSWITGACVDELPHSEIRAAISRFYFREEVPND